MHEILYEIDTPIEYYKLKFQIGTIRKTSVIFVNGGESVMVWGCMASSGVGKLVFIESTMKKED